MSHPHPSLSFTEIDFFIFDLGGVLINLDPSLTQAEFKKMVPHFHADHFNGKTDQYSFYSDYEMGKISSDEFVTCFNAQYDCQLSRSTLERCWNAMVLDFPLARIELLKQLRAAGKKVFLLSNINEIHERKVGERFQELKQEHPRAALSNFQQLFDRVYYSNHRGKRKPNADAFQQVINENYIEKSRALFIDDSIQHIEGAKKIGLPSMHLEKPKTLMEVSIFSRLRFPRA